MDHLLRWARFFSREQMLVLKSEEFFDYAQETLEGVLDFLELPEWKTPALLSLTISAMRATTNRRWIRPLGGAKRSTSSRTTGGSTSTSV